MNTLLVADIGGTYARFAIARSSEPDRPGIGHPAGGPMTIGPIWSTEVRSRNSAVEAIRDFLAVDSLGARIDGALLAVAGPVEGGRCRLTNAAWTIDEEEIAHAFSIPWVRIVNDLEAAAAGLPELAASQTRLIGPDSALVGAPMAILAPGTGLGMACLIDGPSGRRAITSEGGHATLASIGPQYDRLIDFLRGKYDQHVSIERVLSGAGLSNLHLALASCEGGSAIHRTPVEVTTSAFDGSSPLCRAAIDAFCAFLGAVAGDLALTFGARGGVFIGGGIVPRFVDHLARSAFRAQFEAKGRMHGYVARIPTRVIIHPNPALIGLVALARAMRDRPRPARS